MKWNNALRQVRKRSGHSQQEVADHFLTTQQQYCKYENGQQEMTVGRILEFCEYFNCTSDQLLGLDYFEQEDGSIITRTEMLFNEIKYIIYRAEENDYIDDEAVDVLISNIYNAYKEVCEYKGREEY